MTSIPVSALDGFPTPSVTSNATLASPWSRLEIAERALVFIVEHGLHGVSRLVRDVRGGTVDGSLHLRHEAGLVDAAVALGCLDHLA